MNYIAKARWPYQIQKAVGITKVYFETRKQAEAHCIKLEKHGFGGYGKIFPISTWVRKNG